MPFSGLDDELTAFVHQVSVHMSHDALVFVSPSQQWCYASCAMEDCGACTFPRSEAQTAAVDKTFNLSLLSASLQQTLCMRVQVHATENGNQQLDMDAAHRISNEEGARDLAVVEAMLESSRQGSKFVSVSSVP